VNFQLTCLGRRASFHPKSLVGERRKRVIGIVEANREYQRVLEIDGKLPAGEVRRLSDEDRKEAIEKAG